MSSLNGLHVGWSESPPRVFGCSLRSQLHIRSWCEFPGVDAELADLLLRANRISNVSVIDSANTTDPGTFDLTVPAEVDQTQIEHDNISAYSRLLYEMNMCVVTAAGREVDIVAEMVQFMEIFDIWSWIFIFFLVIFLKLYGRYSLFRVQFLRVKSKLHVTLKGLVFMLGLLIGLKVSQVILRFFVAMLTGLYRSGLLARILLVEKRQIFTNFGSLFDLMSVGRIRVLYGANENVLHYLLRDNSSDTDKPWAQMRTLVHHNPQLLQYVNGTFDELLDQLTDHDSSGQVPVYITDQLLCERALATRCGLRQVLLPVLTPRRYRFRFGDLTSTSHRNAFDESISFYRSSINAIVKRYLQRMKGTHPQCTPDQTKKSEASSGHSLSLINLSGVFGLLSAAALLGTVFLLLETLHYNRSYLKISSAKDDEPTTIRF